MFIVLFKLLLVNIMGTILVNDLNFINEIVKGAAVLTVFLVLRALTVGQIVNGTSS